MPIWHRISADKCIDIAGYYTASRIITTADTIRSIADVQGPIADEAFTGRWPVRNTEPRTPISSHKRAMIHERDGGACRYCNRNDTLLVVDHIIPRSAFPADQLHIADRSDNLQSACWECNEERSNYETFHTKRIGVTPQCYYCTYPEYRESDEAGCPEVDEPELMPQPVRIPVYCGRCGTSQAPEVDGWIC